MKSELDPRRITFYELIQRLRAYIREQIDSGEFTERSLSRILRISQPHLHNVLKGARQLTAELADRLMLKFNLTILDLIEEDEMRGSFSTPSDEAAYTRKPPAQSTDREKSPSAGAGRRRNS